MFTMESEIVCPFCQARRRVLDPEGPFLFVGTGQDIVYKCPCGAVALPSAPPIGEPVRYFVAEEELLCRVYLKAERSTCEVDLNHVTHSEPPHLILWARRRPTRSA